MTAASNQPNTTIVPLEAGKRAPTAKPDPTSDWLFTDVLLSGYKLDAPKKADPAKSESTDPFGFLFTSPADQGTAKSSFLSLDFADLNTKDWDIFNIGASTTTTTLDKSPAPVQTGTEVAAGTGDARTGFEAAAQTTVDKHGNQIVHRGKNEVNVKSADGTHRYEKHGTQEETDSPDVHNTYDRKTGVATQTDKRTGVTRTYGPDGFEQRTATGEKTATLKEPYNGQDLPPGKYLGKDSDGDPVFVHVFERDGKRTVVEVEKDDSGDSHKTKVVVRGDDYVLKSVDGRVIAYDKNGKPLFADANGQPQSMTQEELLAHYDQLPPGLQKTLKVLNHRISVQGVEIGDDGYQSEHTRVCRDRKTGTIKAVTENADGKGHAEVDLVAKDHSEIGIQGVSNTTIRDNKATTVDANNRTIASYDFGNHTFITDDATFTSSDTHLNWASLDITSDGDTYASDQGPISDSSLIANCSSAGTNAVDLCQFVSSRFGTESVTGSMCDAMNAAYGHLVELKALCTAMGCLDAIGPIDQGLGYLSSVLPTATVMAAIDRDLSAQGKDKDQILAAQKMISTTTVSALEQGFA